MMHDKGIDYVYLSSYERHDYGINAGILEMYPLVFDNGEVNIYAVSERAQQAGSLQ
jgi:hypothetical protein